jgi:hypothetical protein
VRRKWVHGNLETKSGKTLASPPPAHQIKKRTRIKIEKGKEERDLE